MRDAELLAAVDARYEGRVENEVGDCDMPVFHVAPELIVEFCNFLKQDSALRFDYLCDMCGVDYFPDEPRFYVVYHLYSIPFNHRVRIKCPAGDPPHVPTVTGVWSTANWHEREAFDMYGIQFDNHPDLRRIYMWDEFEGWPMRKDFPLRGYKDKYNPFGDPPE